MVKVKLTLDRRTDKQTDRVIPIYPPNYFCGGYNDQNTGEGCSLNRYMSFDYRNSSMNFIPFYEIISQDAISIFITGNYTRFLSYRKL